MQNKTALKEKNFMLAMKSLWIFLCGSLLLSACTGNQTVGNGLVSMLPALLPEEIIQIADLDLGISALTGTVDLDFLESLENLGREDYALVLTDAIPLLSGEADLSDLQMIATAEMDENGAFEIPLPQRLSTDSSLHVLAVTVEKKECLIPENQFLYCWDNEISSLAFADPAQSIVDGGSLLVWAADDQQTFPEDIGADKKFFTEDDVPEHLLSGFSLVDLSASPYAFYRDDVSAISLHSNYDPSARDLSTMSYTQAFDRIFADMRAGYAFNGVEGKEPDWDAVYALIYPQLQAAEEKADGNAWVSALNAYTQQFSDSHVSISGNVVDQWVEEKYSHGYIYYFTPLSNGDIIYTQGTTSNIEQERFEYYYLGYKLAEINKKPIEEEIKKVVPIFGSYSNPEMQYRAQVRDISHTFIEPGPKFGLLDPFGYVRIDAYKFANAYTITAADDYKAQYNPTIPVTSIRLPSDIGLITIHSDGHQPQRTKDLFEAALRDFDLADVNTILIDMRDSAESRFFNYAGYFSDAKLELGEMHWPQFGDSTAKKREQNWISNPQNVQYSFEKIAVLTGEHCKDGCEAEVYALSLLPQTTLYGETSTFGSFSITGTKAYVLPDQVDFNYSSGLVQTADGRLLIEGTGVQPDVMIEQRLSTYLHDYDWQLPYVEDLLAFESEMQTVPDSIPQPLELSEEELNDLIDEVDQRDIEYLSYDSYPEVFRNLPYTYRVFVEDPGELIVSEKWCSANSLTTYNAIKGMNIEFIVDGQRIDEKYHLTRIIHQGIYSCWLKMVVLDNWSVGAHQVKINTAVSGRFLFDGKHWVRDGSYSEDYTVVVKESE